MTMRTLATAAVLALAAGAFAWALSASAPSPRGVIAVSLGGVSDWLEEPVRRALADATDPRPRK